MINNELGKCSAAPETKHRFVRKLKYGWDKYDDYVQNPISCIFCCC